MRSAAAELRHDARDMRQHLAECRSGHRRHQDIARRDAFKLALTVHHARTSGSPADSRRMPVQSRMREPDLVAQFRLGLLLADVQRPSLKELDARFIHRPFDLDGLSDDLFRLVHHQAELGYLLVIETAAACERARKRGSAMSAAHAVVLPPQRGFLRVSGEIEYVTVRCDFSLCDRRAQSPGRIDHPVAVGGAGQAASGHARRHQRLDDQRHRGVGRG